MDPELQTALRDIRVCMSLNFLQLELQLKQNISHASCKPPEEHVLDSCNLDLVPSTTGRIPGVLLSGIDRISWLVQGSKVGGNNNVILGSKKWT